jgi:hypothetical protein
MAEPGLLVGGIDVAGVGYDGFFFDRGCVDHARFPSSPAATVTDKIAL